MIDFYTEIFIDAEPERVWNAFVNQNEFFMVMYGANIRSSFVAGEPIEYVVVEKGQEVVHMYGEVLAYHVHRTLSYTEHPGQDFYADHAEMQSRITVSFDDVEGITRLTLTNDQFSENNPMTGSAKEWYKVLSNLKTWIETGELMKAKNNSDAQH